MSASRCPLQLFPAFNWKANKAFDVFLAQLEAWHGNFLGLLAQHPFIRCLRPNGSVRSHFVWRRLLREGHFRNFSSANKAATAGEAQTGARAAVPALHSPSSPPLSSPPQRTHAFPTTTTRRTLLRVAAMSRQPEVLWAQRSEKIYLTISLPDAKDVVLKTEPEGLFTFSAVANGEPFSFSLELFDSILPEGRKTRTKIGLRNIICSLQKEKKGWWKRLLKSEEKHPYIKVDWNKWCDDDEEAVSSNQQFRTEASTDSDDNFDGVNDGGESDADDGMLYLPDLEKLRGK